MITVNSFERISCNLKKSVKKITENIKPLFLSSLKESFVYFIRKELTKYGDEYEVYIYTRSNCLGSIGSE